MVTLVQEGRRQMRQKNVTQLKMRREKKASEKGNW